VGRIDAEGAKVAASVVRGNAEQGVTVGDRADIATMKGVSERTVQRQWDKARMPLHRSLAERG
jgi:hypothetical protein